MQKIYISLIKTKSTVSKLISYIKKDSVTHAAIAVDKDLQTLYGFGRKSDHNPIISGFRRENYNDKYFSKFKTLPGFILEKEVTDEQFEKIIGIMDHFNSNQNDYHYSFKKLFSNAIDKISDSENGFICSEFVAYVLQESGVINFSLPLSLIRPQILFKELIRNRAIAVYRGDIRKYRAV